MTSYDDIAEENNDAKRRAFIRKLITAIDEIVAFVDRRLGWAGAGTYGGVLKGSFNIRVIINHGDNEGSAIIRFPIPGRVYEPWRAEKVRNEMTVMKYLREHTTIPLPNVRFWGLAEESPEGLGAFIVMGFVNGTDLDELLKRPTENNQQDVILDLDIDEAKLDIIYDQVAAYMLELSRLTFPHIGAISEDADEWVVVDRPLTYNMNDLATSTGYPAGQFSTTTFVRASDYFIATANEHKTHLQTQRNLATSEADARWRFTARHFFAQLVPEYCVDDAGPFKLFCDDLRPANIRVDPDTFRITAVLDFEFTNAMPAQFAHDPPWWLLLLAPHTWLERGNEEEFLDHFIPRMEQFIRAVERAEEKSPSTEEPRLSARMRDSWDSGRFWFNYASRKSLNIDLIYWKMLHRAGKVQLDKGALAEMELVVQKKMQQLAAYEEEKEKNSRFSQDV